MSASSTPAPISIKNDIQAKHTINWVILSFLTPLHTDNQVNQLHTYGIKIYGGYHTEDVAKVELNKLKSMITDHDIYLCQSGHLYCWHDTQNIEYVKYQNTDMEHLFGNKKQQDKTIIDDIKRMYADTDAFRRKSNAQVTDDEVSEVAKSETTKTDANSKDANSKDANTTPDANANINTSNTTTPDPNSNLKELLIAERDNQSLISTLIQVEQHQAQDYLDDHSHLTHYKYAYINIYTPFNIKGLVSMLFKVRHLATTFDQLTKKRNYYINQDNYGDMYSLEVGKWNAFNIMDNLSNVECNKQLNYIMYHHQVKIKKGLIAKDERINQFQSNSNIQVDVTQDQEPDVDTSSESTPVTANTSDFYAETEADRIAIQQLADYLNQVDVGNGGNDNDDLEEQGKIKQLLQ